MITVKNTIQAHWKNVTVLTFLQNYIKLLLEHFKTFIFKVKCPVTGAKGVYSFIRRTCIWQCFITLLYVLAVLKFNVH